MPRSKTDDAVFKAEIDDLVQKLTTTRRPWSLRRARRQFERAYAEYMIRRADNDRQRAAERDGAAEPGLGPVDQPEPLLNPGQIEPEEGLLALQVQRALARRERFLQASELDPQHGVDEVQLRAHGVLPQGAVHPGERGPRILGALYPA